MRVVVASKFWYGRGGLERVMFEEVSGLESLGHQVAHFSTNHPSNEYSPWSGYFADYIELGTGGAGLTKSAKVRAITRMFHNPQAARCFARLLDDFRPDLVHIHGIHRQLSPSILIEAKSRAIPVVQTLHDFQYVCPNDMLLRGGKVGCTPRLCQHGNYLPAVTHRCIKDSMAISLLAATETWTQRARGVNQRCITRIISPSDFLAKTMQQDGWRGPIDVVRNPVPVSTLPHEDRGYFLVASRLAPEKGIVQAIEACQEAGVRVVVAGDGPLAKSLRTQFPSARFVGSKTGSEVQALMAGARCVIVSSLVDENAPMSVVEAMGAGAAVIGSRRGGIPELMTDNKEGLLVDPTDRRELVAAIRRLEGDAALAHAMGERGRSRVKRDFSPAVHMEGLLRSYSSALGRRVAE